jgi:hypothetical protein
MKRLCRVIHFSSETCENCLVQPFSNAIFLIYIVRVCQRNAAGLAGISIQIARVAASRLEQVPFNPPPLSTAESLAVFINTVLNSPHFCHGLPTAVMNYPLLA